MKVDMEKLMGPEWKPKKEISSKRGRTQGKLMKIMGIFAFCLIAAGAFAVYHQMSFRDSASADTLYNTTPQAAMEQSVDVNWGTDDITIRGGMPISYHITITNPGNDTVDLTAEDMIPDGLNIIESTLSDDRVRVYGRTIKWDIRLDAGHSAELSFTGILTGHKAQNLKNKARILMDDKTVAETNTVTAVIE